MHSRVAVIVVLVFAASCKYETAVERFGKVELEAAKYGFVSAGAIRVAPFQLTAWKELRDKQLAALDELGKEFKTPPKPEWSSAYLSVQELLLNLSLFYKGVPDIGDGVKPQAASSELYGKLQTTLNDLFSKALDSVAIEANRIDMARLRLGYLKYLDNQYENLRLLETLPLDREKYRRVIVSVELTALVRREMASGAVVFLDLYPLHADSWAHYAGAALQKIIDVRAPDGKERSDQDVLKDFDAKWKDLLPTIKNSFFKGTEFESFELRTPERLDPIAGMHHYLAVHRLMPKIVHVDPLDEGELFDQLNLAATSTRAGLSLGASLPNVSALASASGGNTSAQGERSQQINPLSVAFAAGDNRAGWLFFPSHTGYNSAISKPTERRFRMVVDVPKNLKLVAMHVHKMFTDSALQPISGASFEEQLKELNLARHLLSYSEKDYPEVPSEFGPNGHPGPTSFKSAAYWELMKSRMRNILYQGWSENLSFEMPKEPDPVAIPQQTALVEDDGEKAATVVLNGNGGLSSWDVRGSLEILDPRFAKVWKVQIGWMGNLKYEVRALGAEADPTKDQVKLTFPTLAKWSGATKPNLDTVGALKLRIEYEKSVSTAVGPNPPKEFTALYVLKKQEKVPGFAMTIPTRQILIRKDGTGELGVVIKLDKENPAKKIAFEVTGADLIQPADAVDAKNGRQVLQFHNLSERSPVTISAKNGEGVPLQGVTVNVQALAPEEDKGKK